MKRHIKMFFGLAIVLLMALPAIGQEDIPSEVTLIKNVTIFDGKSEKLLEGHDVLVVKNRIEKIGKDIQLSDTYEIDVSSGGYRAVGENIHAQEMQSHRKMSVTVYEPEKKITKTVKVNAIDGGGLTLTPGLIDIHWHTMLMFSPTRITMEPRFFIGGVAAWELEQLLMRGVTTIRDTGGDTAGIQKAIDQGYLTGPRIYPSQAVISQYSGHIDFRNPNDLPREWVGPVAISDVEKFGITKLVNGDQQMLAAVRDNLYEGATQIKLAISGGVMSYTDPLYVNEFLPEEIEAAVRAAEDFGTYVTVHVHNASAIKRALKAGVKSFDHLSLADEESIKMMAEAGAHGSVQILVAKDIAEQYPKGDVRQLKAQEALDNIDKVMRWAKEYKLHMGWGTDLCDTIENRTRQLETLKLKKQWFSDAEIMVQATGNSGETVALCGKRNPYGKLGVIEENAMADILIYTKNPLEDVSVVEDYENNLVFVMKDGKIYKNELSKRRISE